MRIAITIVLLQSATAYFITKCDGLLLQSATILLKIALGITKSDRRLHEWIINLLVSYIYYSRSLYAL